MAGEADIALGLANAGIQVAGNAMIQKKQRAIQRLQSQNRGLAYQRQDEALQRQQEDLNRSAHSAGEDIKSDAAIRGITNSSIPQASQDKLGLTHERRYNLLAQQRSDLYKQKMTDDKIREYAIKADKMKRMFGMINSAIGGGASGALNTYTDNSLYGSQGQEGDNWTH